MASEAQVYFRAKDYKKGLDVKESKVQQQKRLQARRKALKRKNVRAKRRKNDVEGSDTQAWLK